jgi:Ca2+-binding EF-hand superfamily protein
MSEIEERKIRRGQSIIERAYRKRKNLNEMFMELDTDHNGEITYDEFMKGLKQLGVLGDATNNEDIEKLLEEMRVKSKGDINYTEFVLYLDREGIQDANNFESLTQDTSVLRDIAGILFTLRRHLLSTFLDTDSTRTGRITFDEFIQAMRRLHIELDEIGMRALFPGYAQYSTFEIIYSQVLRILYKWNGSGNQIPDFSSTLFGEKPVPAGSTERRLDVSTMQTSHDETIQLLVKKINEMADKLQKIFSDFDTTHNGTVSYLEFRIGLQTLDIFVSEQDMRSILEKFDTKKNGQVQYFEFVSLVSNAGQLSVLTPRNEPGLDERVRRVVCSFSDRLQESCSRLKPVFNKMKEEAHKGTLKVQKLSELLIRLGFPLDDPTIKILVSKLMKPAPTEMTFTQFLKVISGAESTETIPTNNVTPPHVIMARLSRDMHENLRQMKQIFFKDDEQGYGSVTFGVFKVGMYKLMGASDLSDADFANSFNFDEINENTIIDFDDFVALIRDITLKDEEFCVEEQVVTTSDSLFDKKQRSTKKLCDKIYEKNRVLKRTLMQFDTKSDGTVSINEFKDTVKKIGMEVDDSISVILINKYEKNEDGRIFYGDFVRFLNNGGDI